MDLCFEIAAQIMAKLGEAVTAVDEVHGFRYFDDRDLLGFVDGTENPRGQAVIDAALIGAEDAAFAGGSYVITQKYLHGLSAWNALPTETSESFMRPNDALLARSAARSMPKDRGDISA